MEIDVKTKAMKKVMTVLLIWFLLFAVILSYGIYWLFFDWSRFKDELIAQSTSPNGTYTINAYLSNGGATLSHSVLGELVFNEKNEKPKKIYWEYKIDYAIIEWLDDDTVVINGVQLELPKETYDYRRGIK
ncbi:DUF5412 domain-containing protein [Ureibacillus sp. FSL K6-3587]|uniref:DUF5412 domain-containing protein n=1 Tax=Ureibacillus sp. FSL K6-3587 TaxID=2954681 RepID=UPI003158DB67